MRVLCGVVNASSHADRQWTTQHTFVREDALWGKTWATQIQSKTILSSITTYVTKAALLDHSLNLLNI